jgi:hypothetical protein
LYRLLTQFRAGSLAAAPGDSVALINFNPMNATIKFAARLTPSIRRTALVRFLLLAAAILYGTSAASAQIYHDPHKKQTIGFSVDLTSPAEKVAQIVKGVANDGLIRGTAMYAKESDLDDADSVKTSTAFPDPPGAGQVFYKVKSKVISPQHFPAANDIGTVSVRYVVESVGADRTHLAIDAVFITDAGHRLYASDGNVETAEYGEIMIQLKALDAPKVRHRAAPVVAAAEPETTGLQNSLADEQSRLAEAKATEQKLQERVKQLQFNTQGRIRGQAVPLKASPYDHSTTVLNLDKGLTVTVLTTTKYWYRVRTSKGDEGWIYYAFLEPLS